MLYFQVMEETAQEGKLRRGRETRGTTEWRDWHDSSYKIYLNNSDYICHSLQGLNPASCTQLASNLELQKSLEKQSWMEYVSLLCQCWFC